jgi:solute carrier family 13 (sodium-dependent dicarboxylate transporter), member 2/3/5
LDIGLAERIEAPPLAARIGLIAGPVLAVLVFFLLPGGESGLTPAARACGGVATLMAVWWMTEALPLEATALLPLVLLPLSGIYESNSAFKRAAAPYADPAIFLFLGGFMIALAIERWGLHRRIALLTLLAVGTSPSRLVGGFLLATGLISMWISNTATAVMMLPIGMAVVGLLGERMRGQESGVRGQESGVRGQESGGSGQETGDRGRDAANLASSILLAIAYAASLGGFATLVGTPPNIYFAGYMRDQGLPIDFGRWMLFATPLSWLYLLIAWWLLTRWLFPVRLKEIPGGRELIDEEYRKLGKMSRGEWTVLVVFVCTAALWMFRGALLKWEWLTTTIPATKSVDDSVVAMMGAIALFLIPVDPARHVFALDWKTAVKLPWGVLLLFGGGLSLAGAMNDSGLARWIGQQVGVLAGLPTFWQIALIVALIVFSGELTSNLAAVVALLPILFEVAQGLKLDPLLLCVPAVVAASCGFMLPVATPPNAIVFGSGQIKLGQMVRAGLLLDLVAVMLVPIFTYLLGPAILGIKL